MINTFKLKFLKCKEQSLTDIGFDKSYTKKAIEKHSFKTIKIYDLSCAQANIIKQTALTCGTDCSVHREVITGKIEYSDCILSGSVNELKKIAEKLKYQPLKLSELSEEIKNLLSETLSPIAIRDVLIDWKYPYIMGILNITPDSFSDGGQYDTLEKALKHYKELILQGADMIDIGGESTRPGAMPAVQQEEEARVIPVIKAIRAFDQTTILSIDTRNALTAQKALEAGADIVNDISACEWDNDMVDTLAAFNCPIILNHSSGTPQTMQFRTNYTDVVEEIFEYFYKKINDLTNKGIEKNKIIIDPGIGFGKTTEQNFEIINRLDEFESLQCPILVGHSRKNFLKETINNADNEELDKATAILTGKLTDKNANIIRVHNVKLNKTATELYKSFV